MNTTVIRSFEAASCRKLSYRFRTTRDKFDVDKFRNSILLENARRRDRYSVTCAPREPSTGDYHVHFSWEIEEQEVTLRVEYVRGAKAHENDEREPYAEDVMEWLGQSFKNQNAHAYITAEYAFSAEQWHTRLLLPLRTATAEGEAEIDGMSMKLIEQPAGVAKLWITSATEHLRVTVAAERRVQFKAFTPYDDLAVIAKVLGGFVEEKK